MDILPAIDIKDGRAVRLYQGDYNQVTLFPDSVGEMGRRWQAEGARWLHVVDLDGARLGHPVNTALILELRQALSLRIEVGGGLRTWADIATLLDAGVERVILGTAALEDPALLDRVLARDLAALVVTLDARDGIVATAGWLQSSGQRAEAIAAALAERGVRLFSHTDIASDGALRGPNYAALASVQAALAPYGQDPCRHTTTINCRRRCFYPRPGTPPTAHGTGRRDHWPRALHRRDHPGRSLTRCRSPAGGTAR